MPRYIDADLAIEQINQVLKEKIDEKHSTGYFALEKFKEALEVAPTANVAPIADTVKKLRHKIITQIQTCRQMRLLPSFGLFYQIITETTEELLSKDEREGEG